MAQPIRPGSGLHLTAPTQPRHRRNTHSNQSDVGLKIQSYITASRAKFQIATEKGKKCSVCQESFIRILSNPLIGSSQFYSSFISQFGLPALTQLGLQVSSAIIGVADATEGLKLLQNNFRIQCRLTNEEGKTPLEQYYDHLRNVAEIYTALAEIDALHASLLSYQAALSAAQVSTDPLLTLEAAELEMRAVQEFKELSPKAKGFLSKKIWELDQRPPTWDYGYNKCQENILSLLEHKGTCPIDDCSKALEAEAGLPLQLVTTHAFNQEILATDSPDIIGNLLKLYDLQNFKILLRDPFRNHGLLVDKFNRSPFEFRDFLSTIVWMSDFKFKDKSQREKDLREHIGLLANIESSEGRNIIDQLISHHESKIQAARLEQELTAFIQSCPGKSADFIRNRYNQLSGAAQEGLRYKVWFEHGGRTNPRFGGWNYGHEKILSEPFCLFQGSPNSIAMSYLIDLQNKWRLGDQELLADLDRVKILPKEPIDVSTRPLEMENGLIDNLPLDLRVTHISAECSGIASIGGLGSAVDGIVRGFSPENSRLIMPLYRNGPIPSELINRMEETDHQIHIHGRKFPIRKLKINGVRCYFIDAPDLFWIPKKEDQTTGNFYNGDYQHNKYRWAVFQRAAADLSYAFSKKRHPVKLVHVHDSQTALVPKFLKELHPEEWSRGETPVSVFTFHNNRETNTYYADTKQILQDLGLPNHEMNSFIEGLTSADIVTTVSKTYGKEAQLRNGEFGNGMHDHVKLAAFNKKLYGIVNGNSNGFNPAKDPILQNWTSVLPETHGQKVDLRFGPHLSNEELAEQTKKIQRELCAYLKQLDPTNPAYANLDPEKPIVMYLGRYDISQKGVDKFKLIMEETLANGGQFICVGTEPDDESKAILHKMKEIAKQRNHQGVLILEDRKVDGQYVYQGVFGSLLRGGCTHAIFPSIYEPCGLVQGEFNRFKKKVIAPDTGGFPDTLKKEGPDANAYLFKRCDVWYSQEQDEAIKETLRTAIAQAVQEQRILYHGTPQERAPQMEHERRIMQNAIKSTWETTPDGSLSAIRLLELVYAKGFQTLRNRGKIFADLKTVSF